MIPPLVSFVIVMMIWQLAVLAFSIPPYVLPGPIDVARAGLDQASVLIGSTWWTAMAALAGFVASLVVGVLIAFAFSQSRLIRRGLYPYAIFLQTVPIVAIAPLIILWFGTGFRSVVLVSFMISLFPIITNVTSGLLQVDAASRDLFRLYRATRVQTLLKLQIPHAVPYVVAGARISSGLSVIGAIVGEFFAGYGASQHGLGYVIVLSSGQLKTALLFAAIFMSTFLGLVIFTTVGWAGDRVLSRWQDKEPIS